MGPPKSRKVKSNTTRTKQRGGENGKMNEQLATLGLKVVNMTGDGNCFFRAIADQLDGNEEEHSKYRRMVVDYLEEHKPDFEPFLEEETPFDEYCRNMREDGTWAGHMELQATSLATKCNICIHRILFPRWQIMNFQNPGTPVLQLSYHGEEHYNSVRPIADDGEGPPKLETVKTATKLVNEPPPSKDGKEQGSKAQMHGGNTSSAMKLVMAGAGCSDAVHVKRVLDEVHGDTSAAIEYLIAERNFGDGTTQSAKNVADGVSGEDLEEPLLVNELAAGNTSAEESKIKTDATTETGSTSRAVVSRNKACPCGSKKKYKACCGAIHPKPSVTILTSASEGTLSNKARKNRSKAAKASAQVGSSSDRSSEAKADLGVLCI